MEDLGGPTPENYKVDDDSAKLKTPGGSLKQVKDVVNKGAKAADAMKGMKEEEEVSSEDTIEEEEAITDEVVAEEETETEAVADYSIEREGETAHCMCAAALATLRDQNLPAQIEGILMCS